MSGTGDRWARRMALAAAVIGALGPAWATAQQQDGSQAGLPGQSTLYVDAASVFPIRIQLPADYNERRTYSLVVGLHGHGGRADEFFTPAADFAAAGLIYAVPQAPYALPMAGRIGYSWNLRGVDSGAGDLGELDLSMRYVLRVIDTLKARYPIEKVYLMGFSQGGGVAYRTAIRNHDLFAGLMAFGTSLDPDAFSDEELADARDLRVFIGHGRADRVAERSAASHATLRRLGYEAILHDYEGGHTIARSALAEMFRWMEEG